MDMLVEDRIALAALSSFAVRIGWGVDIESARDLRVGLSPSRKRSVHLNILGKQADTY